MKSLIIFFFFSIQLFAGIGVGESPTAPLPVELTSFTAKVVGNIVELNWTTATEVSNYGFEIERGLALIPSQREGTNNIKLGEDWIY